MTRFSAYFPFVLAMALVVVASNVAVLFPVQGQVGQLSLADILTWGAFTYPISFLITDLANRRYGASVARRIVFIGFMAAIAASIIVPPLLFKYGFIAFETDAGRLMRIAMASGSAFLLGQMLDVTVFDWLRKKAWWQAPVMGSLVGSVVDTTIFFSVAFAASFALLGPQDGFALEHAPIFGVMDETAPRWVSWALGDLGMKLSIAVLALVPYRLIAARWTRPEVVA
ncbi:queuosine precursor transporter [Mesorhizobium sp. NBSH29]|uniref:queuosine precursor transporter n=1 Tax=Mesorhizobium sp. NBSH29 TaxID=2654249 RepID=UPI00189690E6|nr:queuosine precursor transporter [Mesorhizobium sp. NBSH29]QPC85687.1 queuosine precursor transporter [Mesorhizobium sp. NBSH29]